MYIFLKFVTLIVYFVKLTFENVYKRLKMTLEIYQSKFKSRGY